MSKRLLFYEYSITYTELFRGKTSCGCMGESSQEEAIKETVELAKLDGWTQPKWWQFWRWRDTRVPKKYL